MDGQRGTWSFEKTSEKPTTLVLTHATPEQAHEALSPKQQLRGDGEETPLVGHTLEFVRATVLKLKP